MNLAIGIALTCLAVVQEPTDDIGRAILELSNEEAQVRATAEATLMKQGLKAFPALCEASKSANSRTRDSVRRIMARIDRIEFEKFHDAENRKEAMEPSTNGFFQNYYPIAFEGGRCKAAVYEDKGGLALFSAFSGYPNEFAFEITTVNDISGKPLVVERCNECSPEWVHLKHSGPVRVKYAVMRRWFSLYELRFENPKDGDQQRVGDFTVTVKWPELEITSAKSLAETVLNGVAQNFWFDHKDPDKTPQIPGGGGHYKGRFQNTKKTTWCTCEGGPKPVQKREAVMLTSRRIKYALSDVGGVVMPDRVDQVALIRFTLSKPFEERFEIESPELKPSKVLGER